MSCPIPIRIINPHYKKIASLSVEDVYNYEDRDDFYIDVPCGKCYHCKKSYKTSWNLRLQHEFKYYTVDKRANCYFITLTFRDEYLPEPVPSKQYIAKFIRKFFERVRKHYHRSPRHWIVSEYGKTTERYHLHGILFDPPFPIYELPKLWSYGFTDSKLLTLKRITYVTTYVNKAIKGLLELPHQKQHIFASPGLGKSFTDDPVNRAYSHLNDTPVPFIYHSQRPFAMPRYYRSKFFTPEELEDIKTAYFANLSDDVIPPPPYYIGARKYEDYTVFLEDAKKLKKLYNYHYGKPKSKPLESTP